MGESDASATDANPSFDTLFALEQLGDGHFRAPALPTDERRIFGGLTLGQATAAAALTVDEWPCHSFHALFGAAAAVDQPLEITVVPVRDGRSFASRRVEVRQGRRLILEALASFHAGDEGHEYSVGMPKLPFPETLPDLHAQRHAIAAKQGVPLSRYSSDLLLDTRAVDLPLARDSGIEGRRALWFRPRLPFAATPAMTRAALAFASDMGLVFVGKQAHREAGGGALEDASLDHAIWFHRDPPSAEWLLHVQRAPVAVDGRGLTHGQIFTREGVLIASTAQEYLARARRT